MSRQSLIPKVSEFIPDNGEFVILPDTCIIAASPEAFEPANLLAEYLRSATGFSLPVNSHSVKSGDIFLTENGENSADEDGFCNEHYKIKAKSDEVRLTAAGKNGLLRGLQTIRQLLPCEIYSGRLEQVKWDIPACSISDTPQTRWRGLHFDVARHFFTVSEICRFIELAAQHKYNIFHWHLTDDQGWRIEIKKYPRLTEIGAWRKNTLVGHLNDSPHRFDGILYGGFYTQAEIKEVVAFAARRGITIVPEIDMPGHMQAAIAAYPELGNNPAAQLDVWPLWGINHHILNPGKATIEFMKNVLDELLELFPSRYIHIGGDEALKTEWLDSVDANARMTEAGVENADQLQTYFIREIAGFLCSRGRKAIGWDDIIEGGLPENTAIMNWRGADFAIKGIKQGAKVVMAPMEYLYFDAYQADPALEPLCIGGDTPCEKVYRFNPIPPALTDYESKNILGGQGQLWTEYIASFARVEYMLYPRACALAEKLWTNPEQCRFRDFLDRLQVHRQRFAIQNINAHELP